MHTSVHNMIRDCCKTSILLAVIHVRTAVGSPMLLMGKATLLLWIADFKFSHTFIICDRLLETHFLFGISLQKWYSLSYGWDSDRDLFIQGKVSFLTYIRHREDQHNVAVVKSTLKIPLDTMVTYHLGSKDTICKTKWHISLVVNVPRRDLTQTSMYLMASITLKENQCYM